MSSLNNKQIEALKPIAGKQYTRSGLGMRGLSIVVSYGGAKVFYYRYTTHEGKQGRIKIGQLSSSMTLAKAREAARAIAVQVDRGLDPARIKATERLKAKQRTIKTIGNLWDDYREKVGLEKRSADFELSIWNTHIRETFQSIDVRDFNRHAIMDFIEDIRGQKSPALANRIQALITRLAKHAVLRRLLDNNPAHDLGNKPREFGRDRVLTIDELTCFWRALNLPVELNGAKVSLLMAQALKLTTLTLCRRKELIGSRWAELDRVDRILTLPAIRVKNNRVHVVPMSDAALDAINLAHEFSNKQNEFIFPSPRTNASITQDALTRACSRLAAHLDIPHFTPHDLRRTGATFLTSERFGFSRYIVSQVINHKSNKGGAAGIFDNYDKNDYLPEKRAALDKWGQYLESLNT